MSETDRISVIDRSVIKSSDNLSTPSNKEHFSVQDIGIVVPSRIRTGSLSRGQMGYAIVGMRDPRQATPGSYIVLQKELTKVSQMSLPTLLLSNKSELSTNPISSSSSALFASVHPMDNEAFDDLCNAVDRLALNDSGLEVHRTSGRGSSNNSGGPFLGPGLRIGFQGLLHVEVFRQRLIDEFKMDAIVTPPKVPYKITYLSRRRGTQTMKLSQDDENSNEVVIEDLAQWPGQGDKFQVQEPITNVKIICPMEYAGNVMDVIKRKRGFDMETKPMDDTIWLFTAKIPWGEVVTDFHDDLKNCTAGYASFDTSPSDPLYVGAKLSKVDIMLNGDVVEPLAFVSHKDMAQAQARVVCKKLQEVLPRKQFAINIQAKADGRFIASERIRAYRKDVLVKSGKVVGGGDVTRKKKLLEKQKRGKKKQQESGRVTLSQAAFNSVINRS